MITSKIEIPYNHCKNLISELLNNFVKYSISPLNVEVLKKAYHNLQDNNKPLYTGYIDISSNTHFESGGLDYSSFTIGADYLEVYTGYVEYGDDKSCDNSSWEKVFDSKDPEHRQNLNKIMEVWSESFLLKLEINPLRSLLIIDRSKLM